MALALSGVCLGGAGAFATAALEPTVHWTPSDDTPQGIAAARERWGDFRPNGAVTVHTAMVRVDGNGDATIDCGTLVAPEVTSDSHRIGTTGEAAELAVLEEVGLGSDTSHQGHTMPTATESDGEWDVAPEDWCDAPQGRQQLLTLGTGALAVGFVLFDATANAARTPRDGTDDDEDSLVASDSD